MVYTTLLLANWNASSRYIKYPGEETQLLVQNSRSLLDRLCSWFERLYLQTKKMRVTKSRQIV